MDFFKTLKLEHLDGEQKELAENIGLNAYKNLVTIYGGASVYIHKKDTLCRRIRDEKMRKEFDGNYKLLSRKYGLSERQIRDIVDNKQN